MMRNARRSPNRDAPATCGRALRLRRDVARLVRHGLRLNAPPTAVHADRRRRQRETWQRTLAEEAGAPWPR
jgi:hypothetical protein